MGPIRQVCNGIRPLAAAAGVIGVISAAGCGRSTPSDLQDQVDYTRSTDIFSAPLPGSLATLPRDPDTPVAVVNGHPIRLGQWEQAFHLQQMRLRGRLPAEELARLAPRLRQDALQGLMAQLLLRDEVEEAGLEIPEAALDEHMEQLREGLPEGLGWDEVLRRAGATEASVREQVRAQLQVEELLREQLPEIPPPGDEEVREFFEANAERFAEPERADVRQLVLRFPDGAGEAEREAVLERARRLKEEAESGVPFEQLAAEHTEDPRARETGGLLAGLPRGVLPPEVFDAGSDVISGPLAAPSGVQLLRVEGRTPGRERSLDEVREQLVAAITEQRRQAALRDYVSELSAKADIQILIGDGAGEP